MPQRVYKVDFETVENLRASTSGGNNLVSIFILGIGGSTVLSRLLRSILDFSIQTTLLVNISMLLISALIIIYLRLHIRGSLGDRLDEFVDIKELDGKTIKLKPKFFKQCIVPIFSYLFFLLIVIGAILLFLETNNFIGFFSFLLFLSLLSLCNITTIHPYLLIRMIIRPLIK